MIPEIISLLPHLLIIRGDIFPLPFGPSWMNTLQGFNSSFFWKCFYNFFIKTIF